MRQLLFFFLFISFNCVSQQEFEVCDNSNTVTYYTSMDMNGTIEWFLNGNPIGDGSSIDINYDQPGEFQIVAIGYNELGCPGSPVVYNVSVTKCDPLIYYIPNSFTPDGNELNQTFGPTLTSGISEDNFEFSIYNRWGGLIWQSYDIKARWDGTFNNSLVLDGTYVWVMKFDLLDTDEKKIVSGHVTIIR